MSAVPRDYAVAYWQNSRVNQLMNIGPINKDHGDYSYDEYEVIWLMACPGSYA